MENNILLRDKSTNDSYFEQRARPSSEKAESFTEGKQTRGQKKREARLVFSMGNNIIESQEDE